ncbi:MAG: hypothetical protein HY049_02920 [Acidobacteria bacterium]|nr:hypothetical protein [Acidobacteriota bacterium]
MEVLILQGRIEGEWAELLEREGLESIRRGRRVVLDFSGVVFIGRSGIQALVCLVWAGAGIVGCTPLIADVLAQEGIEVTRALGESDDRKASKSN